MVWESTSWSSVGIGLFVTLSASAGLLLEDGHGCCGMVEHHGLRLVVMLEVVVCWVVVIVAALLQRVDSGDGTKSVRFLDVDGFVSYE